MYKRELYWVFSSRPLEALLVEMLFTHLKRILKLDRLCLRGPNGARDEFLLAATAQNLRKLANVPPASQLIQPGIEITVPKGPRIFKHSPFALFAAS
jgi:hypothetical protein